MHSTGRTMKVVILVSKSEIHSIENHAIKADHDELPQDELTHCSATQLL